MDATYMIRQNSNTRQDSRAVGYVRRSTDRQEQSIPDQKKALEAYAAEHGLHLVKFYIDDAISGTSTLGRRAFQQMIGDAESPTRRFDIIVVYDVKRFGRIDNDEAGYYRYKLRTHGVEVRYVSENFNGDATDDLLRPVKQWQARQESRDLSKVTIRGLLSKSDTGFWMGGTPPHGYDLRYENGDGKFLFILRYMPDGSKQLLDKKGTLVRTLARGESLSISKRDHARLVPSDHERVKIIKRLFKMYAEQGKGYRSLADTLNQEGVPTPRGPKWSYIYSGLWTDSTIRSILVNPIYAGDMVWNRRTDGRFHRISKGQAVDRESVHGARLVPNQKEDWIVVRDAHPPLISRRLFEQARQRLESHPKSIEQRQRISKLNTHGKTWNGQRSRFILSGLMKCSLCGYRYQGVTRVKGKKRLDGTQVKTRYYGCGGYITKGKKVCQMNSIPQKILEDRVIDAVLDFYKPYLDKGGRKKLAEAVKKQIGSEGKELVTARQRAQAEQKKIGKIINNLLDNITPTNREYVDRRLNELKKQRQQLEARLEELDQLSLSQAEIDNIVTDSMQLLSGLEFTLRQGLPQEKLVALRQCIERIWIDKPAGTIKLAIRLVPVGNLQATQEFKTSV
jgi:DNA invertase Pin-like site-specific DNA recombinase